MVQNADDSDLNWGDSDLTLFPLKSMQVSACLYVQAPFIMHIASYYAQISFGSRSVRSWSSRSPYRSPWPLTLDFRDQRPCFCMCSNGNWFWLYFSGEIYIKQSLDGEWSSSMRPFLPYQPFDLDLIFKVTAVAYVISRSNLRDGWICTRER